MKHILRSVTLIAALGATAVGCGGRTRAAKKTGISESSKSEAQDEMSVLRRAEERTQFDPSLRDFVHSPAPALRGRTADVLGGIQIPESVSLLRVLLTDGESDVRRRAAFAVARIAASGTADAESLREVVLRQLSAATSVSETVALIDALSAFEPSDKSFALLLRYSEDKAPSVRAAAVRSIGRLEIPAANRPTFEKRAIALLSDTDASVRENAAWALSEISASTPSKAVTDAMLRMLREDASIEARIQASRAFVHLGAVDAAAATVIADESDPRVLAALLSALRREDVSRRCDGIKDVLEAALQKESLSSSAAAALFDAAPGCRDATVVAAAKQRISNDADNAFSNASQDSMRIYADCAAQALIGADDIELLGCDAKRPRIGKLRLIEALGTRTDNPSTEESLRGFLSDADPAVATAAFRALAALGDDKGVQTVVETLGSEDPLLVIAALLSVRDEPERYRTATTDGTAALIPGVKEALTAVYERFSTFEHAFSPLEALTWAVGAAGDAALFPLAEKLEQDTRLPIRTAAETAFARMPGYTSASGLPPSVLPLEAERALSAMVPKADWSAVLQFESGDAEVELYGDAARMTVAGFAHAARSAYYDGSTVTESLFGESAVLGDRSGTGWGDPGWYLPKDQTPLPVERGALVALYDESGAGYGRFFIALSRMPEMDRRAAVFGRVTAGMEVLDGLAEGDVLVRVIILRRAR